ncbi:MAG: ion transporter [Planctomycetota bacterium]|nr:ion transporter [Planctomycetota bacterium]
MNNPEIDLENRPPGTGWRYKTFEVVFGHQTRAGLGFDLCLLIAIICSVVIVSVETLPQFQLREGIEIEGAQEIRLLQRWFLFAEVGFTLLFTIEYGLRIWCVGNPWKYIFSFYGMVDLLAVLPSLIGLLLYLSGLLGTNEVSGAAGSYTVIRSLRLLRIFRLMRIGKLERESGELAGAIWKARSKIIVFVFVVLITVVLAGTLMYELEYRTNSKFQSIPEGIYWAIVTMTTVGYGDITPTTFLGKFVSSLLILIGYSLIIVPSGFVSAEVISGRGVTTTNNRECHSCGWVGHDHEASYCKHCGALLAEVNKPENE